MVADVNDRKIDALIVSRLRRHVGHQVRLRRETTAGIETLSLQCDSCAEILFEVAQEIRKRPQR
jgi:hypothetical protein